MTTATGSRVVPFTRREVWQALTVLTPYCRVCDVSYVFGDTGEPSPGAMGLGTRFDCVPGRLEAARPPQNAPHGEVITWDPERRIGTRLELASETWETDIELVDAEPGSTRVAVTITREPKGGNRLMRRLQRQAMRRMVQQTVESELAKLPDHVRPPGRDESPSITAEQESDGVVMYLRGNVDSTAVSQLGLERCLQEPTVVAIDVGELAYLDSTALHPLVRWARDAARAGRPTVVRGENHVFDRLVSEMGVSLLFDRQS
jgi:anti-anti-sigma regulatory factor